MFKAKTRGISKTSVNKNTKGREENYVYILYYSISMFTNKFIEIHYHDEIKKSLLPQEF